LWQTPTGGLQSCFLNHLKPKLDDITGDAAFGIVAMKDPTSVALATVK